VLLAKFCILRDEEIETPNIFKTLYKHVPICLFGKGRKGISCKSDNLDRARSKFPANM
jgi:hypothetical protein